MINMLRFFKNPHVRSAIGNFGGFAGRCTVLGTISGLAEQYLGQTNNTEAHEISPSKEVNR
jgi:hypothetical protein